MLGNFSFGDYFKHEAIAWCWEFLTKVCGLEEDRLYPSIYENDDEAFEIWNKEIGIPADRIFRFGKEDNFWEHGSGPCGPCSEVYYDRGEKYGCGKPGCTVGCDCDRYMEIWNNVFSQFDNDGHGNYTELVAEEHRHRHGPRASGRCLPGRRLPVRCRHRHEHHPQGHGDHRRALRHEP